MENSPLGPLTIRAIISGVLALPVSSYSLNKSARQRHVMRRKVSSRRFRNSLCAALQLHSRSD